MNLDQLEQQLADYSRAALADVPEVSPDSVVRRVVVAETEDPPGRSVSGRVPGLAVASIIAATAIVLGTVTTLLVLPGSRDATTPSPAIPATSTPEIPIDPVETATPIGTLQWIFRSGYHPAASGVVVWEGRLLGLGEVGIGLGDPGSGLQMSDDGTHWVTAGRLPMNIEPVGLAVYDGYLYVIDRRTRMPEGYFIRYPSAWRSRDLRSWEQVVVEQQTPGDYLYFGQIEIIASDTGILMYPEAGSDLLWILTEDGFVLAESPSTSPDGYYTYSTQTWAIWAVDGGFARSTGSSVLFSEDGASWTEVSSGGSEDRLTVVGRGPDGYLAIAEYGRIVLASDDGLTWRKVASPGVRDGSGEPLLASTLGLMPIGGGWIALGEGYWRVSESAWVSADGADWTGITHPVSGLWIHSPVSIGPDVVLAGCYPFTGERGGWVEIRLIGD